MQTHGNCFRMAMISTSSDEDAGINQAGEYLSSDIYEPKYFCIASNNDMCLLANIVNRQMFAVPR